MAGPSKYAVAVVVGEGSDPDAAEDTKRTSDSIDDIGSNLEKPGILDGAPWELVVGTSSLHHPRTFQHWEESTTPRVVRCGLNPEIFLFKKGHAEDWQRQ